MFKRLLGGTLLLLLATNVFPVEFGLKGGVNSFGFSGDMKFKKGMGFQGGFYVNIPISSKFSLQPELYYINNNTEYSRAGQHYDSFTIYIPPFFWTFTTLHKWDYTNEFSIGWLNLPLLAKFTPVKTSKFRLGLLAGPYAAYRMSCKVVQIDHLEGDARTPIDEWGGDDFKKLDAGATFGINLEMLMKKAKLILDLRYNLGLLKVDKPSNMKTNSIMAMIGIGFE